VNQIDVHGYQQGSGNRVELYDDAVQKSKVLWNSEYGDSDATGKSLVSNLILDFRWLHPTAWVYWQVLDSSGWGLIDANNDQGTIGAVSQKYFALAQFTRHIRQGMEILDGGGDSVVAAYDSANQKLIIVAVNWSSSGQYLTFDLTNFPTIKDGSIVPRWYTQLGSSGSQYVNSASDTIINGTKFWSYFGSNVIQTFEVPNVKL
jgi:galactan endo-1,6-beta-galactosidase